MISFKYLMRCFVINSHTESDTSRQRWVAAVGLVVWLGEIKEFEYMCVYLCLCVGVGGNVCLQDWLQ